eukprot:tig00000640_g2772.t1
MPRRRRWVSLFWAMVLTLGVSKLVSLPLYFVAQRTATDAVAADLAQLSQLWSRYALSEEVALDEAPVLANVSTAVWFSDLARFGARRMILLTRASAFQRSADRAQPGINRHTTHVQPSLASSESVEVTFSYWGAWSRYCAARPAELPAVASRPHRRSALRRLLAEPSSALSRSEAAAGPPPAGVFPVPKSSLYEYKHNAFGTYASFRNEFETHWTDSWDDPTFVDTHILRIHPVKGFPVLRVRGSLEPRQSAQPPPTPYLVVWRLSFAPAGAPGNWTALDADAFTVRDGALFVGRNRLREIVITELEGAASAELWVKVVFRHDKSVGAKAIVRDSLEYLWLERAPASDPPDEPSPSIAEEDLRVPNLIDSGNRTHAPDDKEIASYKDSFPGYTAWNNDLHAAPIMCNMDALRYLGVNVAARVDFPNCKYWDVCAADLKVFSFDNWRGFSLDPCPNRMRREFFDAYKGDADMAKVDVFICSHPAANCELFLPFNKSIVVHATTRLEFGRHDEKVWWRRRMINERSASRWTEWAAVLQKIARNPRNTVAANSPFDVRYIKYHTGVDAVFLPSWCGYAEQFGWTLMGATRPEILLGPYRNSLGETVGQRRRHPLIRELERVVRREGLRRDREYLFRFIGEVYPSGYDLPDLARHPMIVNIPYQLSVMSWFEYYRMNIPLFFPSLKLLIQWEVEYGITQERIYGRPEPIVAPYTPFNPNSEACEDFVRWFQYADFYTWPHIQYFDSWEHLIELVTSTDLAEVSRRMREYNAVVKRDVIAKWRDVMSRAVAGERPGGRVVPQDFDLAMNRLGYPPVPPDPIPGCW